MRHVYGLSIAVLLLAGCATNSVSNDADKVECQAIFDAGSTGTRLWIYYKDGNAWTGEKKQEGSALANLETRKVDFEAVEAVVKLLEDFQHDNKEARKANKKTNEKAKAAGKKAEPKLVCDRISSTRVLATAGMRLAEKHDDKSSEFWQQLHDALVVANKKATVINYKATVTTQTITGYEEGIYAWLARREGRSKAKLTDTNFGIAEMGGVSSQVAFPCTGCANTRKIYANSAKKEAEMLELFVHSFLRLGATQLPKSLGFRPAFPPACEWGAGMRPLWEKEHCANLIEPRLLVSEKAGKKTTYQIKDPHLGVLVPIPDATNVENWYLAGSFGYIDARINGDVHNCCEHQHEKFRGCFDEVRSCFIAIYRPIFLGALGIKDKELKKLGESGYNHSELGRVLGKKLGLSAVNLEELDKELKKLDIEDPKVKRGNDLSWTSGARICEAINCFPEKPTRECSWLPDSKCLVPPK